MKQQFARVGRMRHALYRLWQGLLQPSLLRRCFISVLLVYPLLWLAILVDHYLEESDQLDQTIPHYLNEDMLLLNRFDSREEVVEFMLNAVLRYRCFSDVPVDSPAHFVEVWDQRQQRVFWDRRKHYPSSLLADGVAPLQPVEINGIKYRIERRDGPKWSLRVARPVLTLPLVIKRDAFNPGLNLGLILPLPVALLAIWLALFQGFRPLRQLTRYLFRREALNFAPMRPAVAYVELKPFMQAINSLLDRLRAKTEREKRFVDDAAGALHHPLAMIDAEVVRLACATSAAEKYEAQQNIGQALARAGHVIHQLLELARMDGARAKPAERLDIVALVQGDLAQWVETAWQRDIELSLAMPEVLLFELEKSAFQLILHNLVDNAIRYGHPGGQVEVALSCAANAHGAAVLVLAVADDGPGIATDNTERAFERFWRGVDHDTRGAGLGLSIVRQAAARLGAEIGLGSGINGRGCRFELRFPARSGSEPTGQTIDF